eukprot:Lithocolla_globosa_v1_NODE_2200_length_2113_cov_12.898445.p1 type:complete len:359 gc:universal NODE_2200_length_2113_cov_12.898445:195-1271(+)
MAGVPESVQAAVLVKSESLEGEPQVRGYDFNEGVDLAKLLDSYKFSGFQASNFGQAVDEINRMRNWRLDQDPIKEDEEEEYKDPAKRAQVKCKIYLSYTSNMASCGVREVIRFLVQHKMVDVLVSTAGGIEEDFIKCLAPTYLGSFDKVDGSTLRKKGLNRIGNLLVPNSNYCKFEDWILPIFDQMQKEQEEEKIVWTPSKVIRRLGKEINHPDSIYYWAYKNDIPVYSPALTDGSIGDMLYFHTYKFEKPLSIDIVGDIRSINDSTVFAKKTGMIILGGGLVKHHVCNANLMRNGADFSVFVNTAQEFDGSDAGARPDEALSWGKIRLGSTPVKVYGDATLIFPLLVAQTFAKDFKP